MARKGFSVAGAEVAVEFLPKLDALALRWSERLDGAAVTRSDVIRVLLEEGVDRHDLTADELDRAGDLKVRRGGRRTSVRLHLVDGEPKLAANEDQDSGERRRRDSNPR